MQERTAHEIMIALSTPGADRVDVLVDLVLDLFMEVAALRDDRIRRGQHLDSYRVAYRDNALLSHNSAGPSSGWDKVLSHFYPSQKRDDGRVWRESTMLRRLGSTDAEVLDFENEAKQSETYT